MALYVGNKKYCVVKRIADNTTDILITKNGTYTPEGEYSGYNVVRVQVPEAVLDPLTVTPTLEEQDIQPLNDGFSSVHVEAVTSAIDENILPGNIKEGTTILGVEGTYAPELEELTVDPKTTIQELTSEKDGYSKVTVNPVTQEIDPDILAENIKKGVNILGVDGTVIELNCTTLEITSNGTYTPEDPYNGFSEVQVNINTVNNTDLTVTPTLEEQVLTPQEPYTGFGTVTIKPVDASIDEDLLSENIKEGVDVLGVVGTCKESVTQEKEVTPSNVEQEVVPDEGFTGLSKVTVAAVDVTVDEDLTPENIKEGVDIFGVTGTLVELNAQEKEITPGLTEQVVKPDAEFNALSQVTVKAIDATLDPDLIPDNIKKGVEIFGVTGTMEGMTPLQEELVVTADENTETITEYTAEEGYSGFAKLTLDLTWWEEKLKSLNAGDTETTVSLQDKSIDQTGTYTADPGYDGLGTVTVDLDWVEDEIQSRLSEYVNITVDQYLTGSITNMVSDAVKIRDYACYGMISLTDVTLTACEEIGAYAFTNSNVKSLSVLTPTLCDLTGSESLNGTPIANDAGWIFVPEDLVAEYKAAPNWIQHEDRILAWGTTPPRA